MHLICGWILIAFSSFHVLQSAVYDATIDEFHQEPGTDHDYVILDTVRVTRKSRNHYQLHGSFRLMQNWGNDIVVHYEIVNQRNVKVVNGKAFVCDLNGSDDPITLSVHKTAHFPPHGECPMPKGNYSLNGYELTDESLPPMVPPGKFVLSIRVESPEGKHIVAYKVYSTIKYV
ncbi:uncharacterized protein LOC129754556 [Uranotaenia lowii]|uniref:uncharacterized protein LOC129751252 n=1 Tax=Uranotaenia lowii TaxID=190385 RepID=UPI00247A00E3|nr:uncharacterized protein LOC129751252 [Uranotaenia lowii]XP_055606672.1 uncharacterized protein LOC129754556 [Uranotaenia lowii]